MNIASPQLKNEARADLVTVVIPSYNHRSFVGAAIESVLRQTYPAIQLIVVDDGSTDGSRELLEELAIRHGFDLLVQENQGVCRALNRAIRERAKGAFICLLGSDDIWAPKKIAVQMARLGEEPDSQFCFAQAVSFSLSPDSPLGNPFPANPREGWMLKHVVFRQHVPAGTMLFSRALYDSLGGFDERLREEDWDFVIRAASCTKFVAVREPLLFYRIHASNTMRVRTRRQIFHQKVLILAKNFDLLPSGSWICSLLIHFAYDVLLQPARSALHFLKAR